MYNKKLFSCIAFFIGIFLLLLAVTKLSSPQIKDVELSSWGHPPIGIQSFYLMRSDSGTEYYHISGAIDYHPYQPSVFHITPDTCLRSLAINDVAVPLYALPEATLCNDKTGIDIDFGPYLREGNNRFQMEVWNAASTAPDRFFSIGIYSICPKALCLAFIAVFCAALILLWSRIGMDSKSIAILTAATLAYIWHIYDSGYAEYSYDIGAHIEYILYIIQHLSLPQPGSGWEFYQSPLYYCIAALAGFPGLLLGYAAFIINLRILSLACFIGFLSFSALTLRKTITSHFYYLALFLLAFWPVGTTMAGRINNDILLYFFYSATFYNLVLWRENPLPKFLARTLIFTGLAVATKSTGLLLFPTIAIAIFYKCNGEDAFSPKEFFRRELLVSLACALILCSANFGRAAYYALDGGIHMEIIGGQLNEGLKIRNDSHYFLSFNYPQFLNTPFFSTWNRNSDREYFWNVVLKSSLFGEFKWKEPSVAAGLDFFLMLMVLYVSISTICFFFTTAKLPEKLKFYGLALGLMVAALALARIRYPYSCNQDFRYIYPALVPFLILYSIVLDWHNSRSGRIYWLGILLTLTFACMSFSFILLQHS